MYDTVICTFVLFSLSTCRRSRIFICASEKTAVLNVLTHVRQKLMLIVDLHKHHTKGDMVFTSDAMVVS